MILDRFELSISYHQFAIADAGNDRPFNDWSPQHVVQGFSWRPESACFQTPFEDGAYSFEVLIVSGRASLDHRSTRAIVVPFPERKTDRLEISAIGSSHVLAMPRNCNSILAEFIEDGAGIVPLIKLQFYNEVSAVYRIEKADSDEMANVTILSTAEPA
jgi:hypothetical protein